MRPITVRIETPHPLYDRDGLPLPHFREAVGQGLAAALRIHCLRPSEVKVGAAYLSRYCLGLELTPCAASK